MNFDLRSLDIHIHVLTIFLVVVCIMSIILAMLGVLDFGNYTGYYIFILFVTVGSSLFFEILDNNDD